MSGREGGGVGGGGGWVAGGGLKLHKDTDSNAVSSVSDRKVVQECRCNNQQ